MSSQTVYFNNPSVITKLQGQVGSTAGSINTANVNASGDITGENVYGTNFNLNSFLNNFASNIVGQDKFQLTVDAFGNLKIVPKYSLTGSNYNATVEIDTLGRPTITGDDIQSCFYMTQLVLTLIAPADVGQRRLFQSGNTPDPATNLNFSYIEMKLMELEVQGKIPPVLYSLGKAVAQGNNDAYNLVLPKFKANMKVLSVLEGVCIIVSLGTPYGLDSLFGVADNMFANTWMQYVLFQNNLGPKPAGLNQDLDIPAESAKTSAYLKLGKKYLSDGNAISIGSPHWFNVGTWDFQNIKYKIPSQDIEVTLPVLGGVPLFLVAGWNRDSLFDASSIGYGDSFYLPYVNLVDSTGASYYIGNTVYPIEFEGPVKMEWNGTGTIRDVLGNVYISSQTGTLSLNIPRTKYGPIVRWDTVNNRVYSLASNLNEDWLVASEKVITEWPFLKSVQERNDYLKKYGNYFSLPNDGSLADKNGNISAYNGGTQKVLAYPKIYKNLANSTYNPSTLNDINIICNNSNRGGRGFNVLNGSDPDVYTSLCYSANEWGQDDLGNIRGSILTTTDVVDTCVQHSNTQVIDLNPSFAYPINQAAIDINFNPRLLMNLIGVNSGVTGALELTRQNKYDTYIEMMSQIQTYSTIGQKANNIYNMLYAELGLITIGATGATTYVEDVNEWKNPTNKLTTAQALDLDYDKVAYKIKKSNPGVVSYLESYFASNAPDWTSPFLSAVITSNTAGAGQIRYITAEQATGAVTQAVLQDAVQVLKNWDYTYGMVSTGAFLNQAFWQRVHSRIRGFQNSQLTELQKNNSLFAPLLPTGAFAETQNQWADLIYNDICPAENRYTWRDAIPNFTGSFDGSVEWTKVRDLTEDDRWRVFQKRISKAFGFDASGLLYQAVNATGTGLSAPPTSNGQLMQECFIASILDIYQTRDTVKVALCNSTGGYSFVTTTARTDTAANNIADKIRRRWSHMHTFINPFDFDSNGDFIQYAMPYDQESWIGGGITELRNTTNFSVVGGGYNGYIAGVNLPNYSASGSFAAVSSVNRPASVNQIFSNFPSRQLYRDGYVCINGGSAFLLHHSFNSTGGYNHAFRNTIGINTTNSSLNRVAYYYLQNDITPEQDSLPTVYSLSSASAYNKNAMTTALRFKPNADGISY